MMSIYTEPFFFEGCLNFPLKKKTLKREEIEREEDVYDPRWVPIALFFESRRTLGVPRRSYYTLQSGPD